MPNDFTVDTTCLEKIESRSKIKPWHHSEPERLAQLLDDPRSRRRIGGVAMHNRRRAWSMTNHAYAKWNVTVGTTKKSIAAMVSR